MWQVDGAHHAADGTDMSHRVDQTWVFVTQNAHLDIGRHPVTWQLIVSTAWSLWIEVASYKHTNIQLTLQ